MWENVSKTKTMCLGSKQKPSVMCIDTLNISINGQHIHESHCEKVLGVFVDATLSWYDQINHIIKKSYFFFRVIKTESRNTWFIMHAFYFTILIFFQIWITVVQYGVTVARFLIA